MIRDVRVKTWFGIGFGIMRFRRKTNHGEEYSTHYLVLPFLRIRFGL